MGHICRGTSPKTLKWSQVGSLIARGADVPWIAAASADAAEHSLERASQDEWLTHSLWLAHAHALRHACGYKLANDGHDTRALQAHLGHRNIQNTTRYTALDQNGFKGF
jgi:type 1 fimbriae regulatory protein FimB/type 1 fimbriae regulatory protein FimE